MTLIPNKTLPLPKGSFGLPIIGETVQFLTDPDFVSKRRQKYGKNIFKTNILGRPTVIMSGLEANRFLLSTHFNCFSWLDGWPQNFQELLGRSLFLQEGKEHQRNRRLMMPAFHGKALENYIKTMTEITEEYCQEWVEKGSFAWFLEFKQLTFTIASTLLIGADRHEDRDSDNSVAQISQLFAELANGLFALPLNLPITTYGRALKARNKILDRVESVIAAKRNNLGTDVLSLLMQSEDEENNKLSVEELKSQALLLLFAGHETTTSLLTSFCTILAQQPDLYQKLRVEQESLGLNSPLNLESLKQMVYLERTLQEVERLYPPIGAGFRGVVKEFEFEGYRVPSGWQVLYRIPEANLDPDIFSDPERFNPDRHKERAPDYSIATYGGGSRICLGMAFAKMEVKIIIALLLRSYQWQLQPNQKLILETFPILHPHDNLLVEFSQL